MKLPTRGKMDLFYRDLKKRERKTRVKGLKGNPVENSKRLSRKVCQAMAERIRQNSKRHRDRIESLLNKKDEI